MARAYRIPILAYVFRVLGTLTLVVALLGLAPIFISNDRAWTVTGLLWVAGVSLSGIILLGLGEVIDLIGRAAFHAERTAEATILQGKIAGENSRVTLSALDDIAKGIRRANAPTRVPLPLATLAAIAPLPPPAPEVEPEPAPATPPKRYYYIDGESQAAGPVAARDLQRLVHDGSLATDALVCPEDGEHWQAFGELAMG